MMRHNSTEERGTDRVEDRPKGEVISLIKAFDRRLANIEQVMTEMKQVLQHRGVEKESHSTVELAQAMGVSVYTVTERWCNQGRIEAQKDPGSGKWRIPGREFQRLVRGGALRPKGK